MRFSLSLFIALIPIWTASAAVVSINVQDLDFLEDSSHFRVAAVDYNPTALTFEVDGAGLFTLFGTASRNRTEVPPTKYDSGPGEFFWMPNAGDEGKVKCRLKGELPMDAAFVTKFEAPKWVIALPGETARGPCQAKWGVSIECDDNVECYTGSKLQPWDDGYVPPAGMFNTDT